MHRSAFARRLVRPSSSSGMMGKPMTMAVLTPSMRIQIATITSREDVRNIAVIAHVDHGKTTLVDSMLKQSGTMANAKDRVMDSKAQEKERGITILAKNTAIVLPDKRRINIVDTPGHLDFSGEVERALQMVEGFILLVDAAEGVKPGTRYVLRKALNLKLKPIVVLNKIDKDDAKLDKTVSQVEDLFLEACSDDSQLDDLTFMYGSGRAGYINDEPKQEGTLTPLFEKCFEKIPAPAQPTDDSPFQMLCASLRQNDKDEKVAIGRIFRGAVKKDDVLAVCLGDQKVNTIVRDIRKFLGTEEELVKEAAFGDVVAMTLQEPLTEKIPLQIGSSLCDKDKPDPWPYHPPDEPTFSLVIQSNEADWKGKEITEDKYSQFGYLRKRLLKEAMVNTALKLLDVDTPHIRMMGRGPLHLGVIIEDLRREGFEFELRAPSVMTKVIDGEEHEPYEKVVLEYNEKNAADVIQMLAHRNADIGDMETTSNNRIILHSTLPVRMMLDLPLTFNRITGGDGVLNHSHDSYKPIGKVSTERETGALIAGEGGEVTTYALAGLATNGRFFVEPGDEVKYGQIIGENTKTRGQDLPVNPTKRNTQLGGFRANAKDAAQKRGTDYVSVRFGLEDYISWAHPNELITVTPKSVRMRNPKFKGKTMMRTLDKK